MGRHLAAVLVVMADVLLFAAAHPPVAVLAYAPAGALLVFARRGPLLTFAATLGLAVLTGGSYPLLIWVAYRTGLAAVSRRDSAVVAGAVVGWAAVTFVLRTGPEAVGACLVFVVLPLLVGRYLAQQRRLVDALEARNSQLRRERELLAEREQLRERLRISRDMHDSLGRRLSLVSVQAAALEVSELPAPQRIAVESLATATRAAVTELYELIGSLRGSAEEPAPGLAAVDALAGEFRTAGVAVTVCAQGDPRPLSPGVDTAAFRVVEEGLTNAAKHAEGHPVTVRLDWEPDALVLSVTNPVADRRPGPGARLGLAGLRERVEPAGGFLDHRETGGWFRLVAMLPTSAPVPAEPEIGRVRATALGVVTGALLFAMLPATMLTGVS
ncbi:sensor histidine kinase [Actinophytocola sediminis]